MIVRERTGIISTNLMRAFSPYFSKAETGFYALKSSAVNPGSTEGSSCTALTWCEHRLPHVLVLALHAAMARDVGRRLLHLVVAAQVQIESKT
jgi:hypothetical protein